MINLLPQEKKQEIRAGLANGLLLRYNFFLLGVIGFILLGLGFTFVTLVASRNNAESNIQQNTRQIAEFAETEAAAHSFRDDLATARQIIDNETRYTEIIAAIAQLLPQGVVMESIALDSASFGTPGQFNFQVRSYDHALRLKTVFEQSTLFTDVYFNSISISEDETRQDYPVSVGLTATLNQSEAQP